MRIQIAWSLVTLGLLQSTSTKAFTSSHAPKSTVTIRHSSLLSVTAAQPDIVEVTTDEAEHDNHHTPRELTLQIISSLPFRGLISELASRGQSTDGTTARLRRRLRQVALPDLEDECIVIEDDVGDECVTSKLVPPELLHWNSKVRVVVEELHLTERVCNSCFHDAQAEMSRIMTFTDTTDRFQELIDEIKATSSRGHWKAATRKLKKLSRRTTPDRRIPEETYMQVLDACIANRLQGARASEPARKVIEQLVEQGYGISEEVGNFCIQNCLGETGPDSTHQGFGGIDTALAMKAALETAGTPVLPETNEKIVLALAREGSIQSAVDFLRKQVIDKNESPPLSIFAAVAQSAAVGKTNSDAEKVMDLLSYAKAAGYDLDIIAASKEGRMFLAAGVIAAERMSKDALAFRLLAAASNAPDLAERGDAMVAKSSSQSQRAAMLIHKRAINKAVEEGEWKLGVKVLELMLQRSLRPSPWVWRNVVTLCAKESKSRKATGLLLDWVKLSERREADKPPLTVFNTVINACEICNEQDLTILVLDSMKATHETDGNLITFNIALKRLAKLGNYIACEGIIVGMLKANAEPSVVTYTTAIAACVFKDNKQPAVAYEWLRRMRVRNVKPNVITYNTALAACLDGTLASTILASKMAVEMLDDVDKQLQEFEEDLDEYRNVIPDGRTKEMARRLMQQLKQKWEAGEIDKRVATETIRVPLLKLVDFQKSEAAEEARKQAASRKKEEDQSITTQKMEIELEVLASHRSAEV